MFKLYYAMLLTFATFLLTALLLIEYGVMPTLITVFFISLLVSEITFLIESHRYYKQACDNGCGNEYLDKFHTRAEKESYKQYVYRNQDFLEQIYKESLGLTRA